MSRIVSIPSSALEVGVWGSDTEEATRNAKDYSRDVQYLQDAGFSNTEIDEMIGLRLSGLSSVEISEVILQSPDSSPAEIRNMFYLQALDDIVSCVFAGNDFVPSEFLDEMREQNTSDSYDPDVRFETIPVKSHSWRELFSLESWKELFSSDSRLWDFVSHPAVRTLGCAAAGVTAVCLAPNMLDFFTPTASSAETTISTPSIHTYVVDTNFQVVLRELEREGPDLYQIDINITNPSGPYRLIEEASTLMVSKAFVVPEGVKMYYNTSKSDEWVLITRTGREDHALLRGGFGLYKKFIPPVGVVEDILEAMARTFNYIDSKKPDIVKPKHLTPHNPGDGLNYEFFAPVRMIGDKLSPTILYGSHVDGVRFDIPIEELAETGFFVKFEVGQQLSAISASRQYGVEIIDRNHPIITGQIRGRLIDFEHRNGILIDSGKEELANVEDTTTHTTETGSPQILFHKEPTFRYRWGFPAKKSGKLSLSIEGAIDAPPFVGKNSQITVTSRVLRDENYDQYRRNMNSADGSRPYFLENITYLSFRKGSAKITNGRVEYLGDNGWHPVDQDDVLMAYRSSDPRAAQLIQESFEGDVEFALGFSNFVNVYRKPELEMTDDLSFLAVPFREHKDSKHHSVRPLDLRTTFDVEWLKAGLFDLMCMVSSAHNISNTTPKSSEWEPKLRELCGNNILVGKEKSAENRETTDFNQNWIKVDGKSVEIIVGNVVPGSHYNRWGNEFEVHTDSLGRISCTYDAWYKGKYLGRKYLEELESGLRTDDRFAVSPRMMIGDGKIEGIVLESLEEGKPFCYIFLDEDWKTSMGDKTNVTYGANWQHTVKFDWNNGRNGIYFMGIEDDPQRFIRNPGNKRPALPVVVGNIDNTGLLQLLASTDEGPVKALMADKTILMQYAK